jgi:hypothetical protein
MLGCRRRPEQERLWRKSNCHSHDISFHEPGIQSDEAGLLSAFDSHRDLIHAAAVVVYRRGRKGLYELKPADF